MQSLPSGNEAQMNTYKSMLLDLLMLIALRKRKCAPLIRAMGEIKNPPLQLH